MHAAHASYLEIFEPNNKCPSAIQGIGPDVSLPLALGVRCDQETVLTTNVSKNRRRGYAIPQRRNLVNRASSGAVPIFNLCLIFRPKRNEAMGGAETSMLRMIASAQHKYMEACVILFRNDHHTFREGLVKAGVEVTLIRGYVSLFRHLRKRRPDVLYMFARLHSSVWSIVAFCAGVGTRLIAERGNGDGFLDRISHLMGRTFADGLIANSMAAKNCAVRSGFPKNKIWVVYNGIDDVVVQSKGNEAQIESDGPLVLTVANISPGKDILTTLKAVQWLKNIYPSIRLTLIGEDYTRGSLFKEAKVEGLSDSYVWLGRISDPLPFIKRAVAIVLSSKSEGMPTSILEAMLLQRVVIATAVGGIPELVRNNETGFLFEIGDWRTLARLLLKTIENQSLRDAMGSYGREIVLKNHSLQSMIDGHCDAFYESLKLRMERHYG